MKFVTNRISTGNAKSFNDIIKEYQEGQEEEVKVASSVATVKTAEKEEADSSGQLDVEPLHQEGESTTMPKNGPDAKKKAATDPEAEGEDSGQPKAEGSEKLTNDPKVEEEAKGGSSDSDVKEAALEDLPEEVQDKIKGKGEVEEEDKEEKEAEVEEEDKEEKEAEVEEEDKEEKEAEAEEEDKEEKEASTKCAKCECDPCECEKEAEVEEEDKEEKEASSVKFVKIANLDAKNKGFLREYWTKLYGEDYVNALLADK